MGGGSRQGKYALLMCGNAGAVGPGEMDSNNRALWLVVETYYARLTLHFLVTNVPCNDRTVEWMTTILSGRSKRCSSKLAVGSASSFGDSGRSECSLQQMA